MNLYSVIFLVFICLVNANIYYDSSNEEYINVKNSRNFSGKVVLVTGSTSGIGEGIVKLFAVLGARVVVTGRNATNIRRVAEEVQNLSPNKLKPLEVVADVTKSEDLERLLNQTINAFGRLDVLVNNAGIGISVGVRDKNFIPAFDQIIATNLRPYVELSHLSVPYLEQTNGTIISISSLAAFHPFINGLAYGVSKAGIDMMTKVLALELAPKIRVNTINPGVIETNFGSNSGANSTIEEMIFKKIISLTPLKKTGQPLDIAKATVFLASSDAQFITGANLVVDGGIVYNVPGDIISGLINN